MIHHLLKIVWNRKRKSMLLIVEIFISFLVLFGVFTMGINYLKYMLNPRGFNYEDVYVLSVNFSLDNISTSPSEDSLTFMNNRRQIKNFIISQPEAIAASYITANLPYNYAESQFNIGDDTVNYITEYFVVEDDFFKVLEMPVTEGKSFDASFNTSNSNPTIVNRNFYNAMKSNHHKLGKLYNRDKKNAQIVGVIENFKSSSDYSIEENVIFLRANINNDAKWKDFFNMPYLLIKVKKNTDMEYESRIIKQLTNMFKDYSFTIRMLDEKRKGVNQAKLIPLMIMFGIGMFLIINVALGLYGILWYNLQQRKSEIGLRQAMGAPRSGIRAQFIGETLVLSLLGIILGIFIAVQFPLMNVYAIKPGIYLSSMAVSAIFILMITSLCALYPSSVAARVQPAQALRDE